MRASVNVSVNVCARVYVCVMCECVCQSVSQSVYLCLITCTCTDRVVKGCTIPTLLNYSRKVKEHFVQQPQFLLFNLRVVLPWCTQALAFIELSVDNVNSEGFNVSLAKHHYVRIFMWQKC
jgi:hypothetical protein